MLDLDLLLFWMEALLPHLSLEKLLQEGVDKFQEFHKWSANNLTIMLKSGSLPTEIKIIQEKQVVYFGEGGCAKRNIRIISIDSITLFMIAVQSIRIIYNSYC